MMFLKIFLKKFKILPYFGGKFDPLEEVDFRCLNFYRTSRKCRTRVQQERGRLNQDSFTGIRRYDIPPCAGGGRCPVSMLRLRTQSIPQGTHVTVGSEDVMY